MTTLLVGTYTERMSHVDGHGEGILVAEFDDGRLTTGQVIPARNPSWLAYDQQRQVLFAVSEVDDDGEGWVLAFEREQSGRFREVSRCRSGGSYPAHAGFDSRTGTLIAANYGSGSIVSIQFRDGQLRLCDRVQHQGSSIDPTRQEGPHAHQALLDEVAGQLLVPDLGTDSLQRYRVGSDGGLSHLGGLSTRPGTGPRHATFVRGGQELVVLNELDASIDRFARDGEEFRFLTTTSLRHPQPGLAAAIRSTSNDVVLASVRGPNEIAMVSPSGTAPRFFSSGGLEPRDLVVSPGEDYVLVANQDSDQVSIFSLDTEAMTVQPVGSLTVPSPACLLFLP